MPSGLHHQGDKYIIERKGKPTAVVAPLEVYESWKRSRSRLFDLVRQAQENSGEQDPEALMALALEAQAAVRAESGSAA